MNEVAQSQNFIQDLIDEHLAQGRFNEVVTRFPPEPNGYLHIGHAKSICLNFGLAQKYQGRCHLRMDDTNPAKEEVEYIHSIEHDVRWLGFSWGKHYYYASDYFNKIYEYAEELIQKGLAYVCDLTPEEQRLYRGTLTEPGKPSPYRNRSISENLELFNKMRKGDFPDGACVLRAKIDMASGNINMRDPILYRIKHISHHRTGTTWCIYPMYDFAHCVSDALEGITHSICTLEFEDHRPLYDWLLNHISIDCHPQQIEFARLNLTYTVMSKRLLLDLVVKGKVDGWDDPRMPTLSGLRRRGYTPAAIRNFAERIGVAKRDSVVDLALLEHCVREDLNSWTPRRMAVLKPLKIIISNYPDQTCEQLEAINNPENPAAGSRQIPFGREIYIEQEDFMEVPPKNYYRLAPGQEVRLRYAYFIQCQEIIKDPTTGEIDHLICTYDPQTKGGNAPDGRKVKGTLHWVSAKESPCAKVRLYNNLLTLTQLSEMEEGKTYLDYLDSQSLVEITNAYIEPDLAKSQPGETFQFERLGYFTADSKLHNNQNLVFNRTVTLKDTWAKIQKRS